MSNLITDYKIELVEPGCSPGSAKWGAQVILPDDISEVFPYMNAIIADAWYDHENKVLIWGDEMQKYALRPREIRISQIMDAEQAHLLAREVVDRINQVWEERADIVPRTAERRLPTVMDILRILPRTNCRQCGYPTCMAFAADLRRARARLEQCSPLAQPEYSDNKRKLAALIFRDQA